MSTDDCVSIQVIGVVYRNTPYLLQENTDSTTVRFFDFFLNSFGFAMPFPICLWPDNRVPTYGMAFIGYIPPFLVLSTAGIYICWWVQLSTYVWRVLSFM